jgi:cell wall-associated NlpC family hydrolase
VTTDDLTTGQPAATRARHPRMRAGALRFLCALALCAAGTSVAFAQSAPAGDAASAQVVLATTAASYANSSVAPPAAAPSSTAKGTTHVRPLFGDLSDLADAEPGAKVEFDSLGKPRLTDRIQNVLTKAMTLLGTPYRWGGESTDGFDCSGLVGYVYRTVLGMDLPRVSRQMAQSGEAVTDRAALAPGDLVFFGLRGRVSHVGIYVGEGRFLHAPSRGKDVRVDSLYSSYWSGRYLSARRVAM